ncbi:hypothetical protein K503DRAFT_45067 [Rhizopogon vinicolor AM-OR11-026]|uniref:Uncharacterized protein n=1 Tax=Rhizopogon vinicolor AM-OR11-026 TaxID=1314800 RepID=A0A1B7N4X1_9AGAM|nr:hypothetical protein K503DRAFT_45067 [Rhizopogon vinicolor AM-OR11-026]
MSVDFRKAFLMMHEMVFSHRQYPLPTFIPLHLVAGVSRLHLTYNHMLFLTDSPRSSTALSATPMKQPHSSSSQDTLVTVLLSPKLRQHKTNRHCMLLVDLATRGNKHCSSKPKPKRRRPMHLRRLP